MKKLTTTKQALEAFAIYQIEKSKEIKGGADIIVIEDIDAG